MILPLPSTSQLEFSHANSRFENGKNSLLQKLRICLENDQPKSREQFISTISKELGNGRLRKTIDTHNTNSIVFLCTENSRNIVIKAEFGANTSTHKEADWYISTKKLTESYATTYEDSSLHPNWALLQLRYIKNAISIDEAQMNTPNDTSIIKPVLQALEMDRHIFSMTARKVNRDQVNTYLLKRYYQRQREASHFQYLREMMSFRNIVINGRPYLSPDTAMKLVVKNRALYTYLTPNRVGISHGDLHCGNILSSDNRIHLIDPNGSFILPIEYDLGKLLHSVHGNYARIMRNDFILCKVNEREYVFLDNVSYAYQNVHQRIRSNLSDQEYLQSLYFEALHFTTMLPHHASVERETITLYLRAAQLFNELLHYL